MCIRDSGKAVSLKIFGVVDIETGVNIFKGSFRRKGRGIDKLIVRPVNHISRRLQAVVWLKAEIPCFVPALYLVNGKGVFVLSGGLRRFLCLCVKPVSYTHLDVYKRQIENKGQHPSLQIFFELMLRYNISVDQLLLETPPEKNTQRRQLDALLDGMSDTGIRIVSATAKEIAEVETEGR